MAKSALGKGLSSLMGTPAALVAPEPIVEKGESIRQVSRLEIIPSPLQPRKVFRAEQLVELTESIRERGVVQPLIVRWVNQKYELIAGERRWRASGEAGLEMLPVIVREASDRDVLELALIENIQRADLNPLEEAQAYARLMEEFSLTQEEVAQKVGKGRVSVANAVRLLALPRQIRAWVEAGDLSVGHAKVLLSLPTEDEQLLVAEQIRRENLTVRATERLIESIRQGVSPKSPKTKKKVWGSAIAQVVASDLEKQLQQHLGTRVKISGSTENGKLELYYFSPEELERILQLIHFRKN